MSLSTFYLKDGRHLARLHRRRRRRAYVPTIPLATMTMRKSIHGFPLVCYMGMGLHLAAQTTNVNPPYGILLHAHA